MKMLAVALWVAFGNSITAGALASAPEFRWVNRVATAAGVQVDNWGVASQPNQDQLLFMQYYLVDHNPPAVLWLPASFEMTQNDLTTYEAELEQGFTTLAGRTVYVGVPVPYIKDGALWPDRGRVALFAAKTREVAARHGGVWVAPTDQFYFPESGDVSDDGIHPNDQGHLHIAQAFLTVVATPRLWLPWGSKSSVSHVLVR